MQPLLRRSLSAAAAASGRIGRALSTAASRPPWAMIYHTNLRRSPALRAGFQLAEPPCASHLFVPVHLIDLRPLPDPSGDIMPLRCGNLRAVSGDGLLLLDVTDGSATGPIVGRYGTAQARRLTGIDMDFDVTRFVCNPLSGELFRLPDIDGTKKTLKYQFLGILTQSDRPEGPPDRYAVAWLDQDRDGVERGFAMRRFLSQTGEWDKLVVGLPSPLPLARRMVTEHEVLAFAGRLWWVDVSCGAVTVDPFSDRPELRFVELPKGSVTEPVEGLRVLGRYRRMGVSEGRLRYAEVSQKKPFMLSSFALDDGGSCWSLEHRVALSRLLADEGYPCQEDTPRIGVIDPLNASVMYLTIGDHAVSVDMDMGKVLGSSLIGGVTGPVSYFNGFLKPCVLPPWLGSSRIPSAGKKEGVRNRTLADVLVRAEVRRDEV